MTEMPNNDPVKNVFKKKILDVARRFFQTKSDEASLRNRGKYEAKVKHQRRRNRLFRVGIYL